MEWKGALFARGDGGLWNESVPKSFVCFDFQLATFAVRIQIQRRDVRLSFFPSSLWEGAVFTDGSICAIGGSCGGGPSIKRVPPSGTGVQPYIIRAMWTLCINWCLLLLNINKTMMSVCNGVCELKFHNGKYTQTSRVLCWCCSLILTQSVTGGLTLVSGGLSGVGDLKVSVCCSSNDLLHSIHSFNLNK